MNEMKKVEKEPTDLATVRAANRAPARARVSRALGLGRRCWHRQAEVDPSARTLVCASCGVPLDPFQFLNTLASQWAEEQYEERELVKLRDALSWLMRHSGRISVSKSGARVSFQPPHGSRIEATSRAQSIHFPHVLTWLLHAIQNAQAKARIRETNK